MKLDQFIEKLRASLAHPLPLPGGGRTAERHRRLMELGRENLSLARLAEAHWDAVAILAEAGRQPVPGALYGVWASEIPGKELVLERTEGRLTIHGAKKFCSGAGIVDRALVTIGLPDNRLIEMDVRTQGPRIVFDQSEWKTRAFAETNTATATFVQAQASAEDILGGSSWYVSRPGFWHGACGPAACWAGGALALVDYAATQQRSDAHTLAHFGAMQAAGWALQAYFDVAGAEIDKSPADVTLARVRALTVRHLTEQVCTDILRRLTRAFGPHPLAMSEEISSRYQELDLYLRQSHAERDLEALGRGSRELQQRGRARKAS